jgi:hypothetical protein
MPGLVHGIGGLQLTAQPDFITCQLQQGQHITQVRVFLTGYQRITHKLSRDISLPGWTSNKDSRNAASSLRIGISPPARDGNPAETG